ncbi:MAG: hypothetical protein ACI4F6_10615 [Acutalibacteraceae bacterium]
MKSEERKEKREERKEKREERKEKREERKEKRIGCRLAALKLKYVRQLLLPETRL